MLWSIIRQVSQKKKILNFFWVQLCTYEDEFIYRTNLLHVGHLSCHPYLLVCISALFRKETWKVNTLSPFFFKIKIWSVSLRFQDVKMSIHLYIKMSIRFLKSPINYRSPITKRTQGLKPSISNSIKINLPCPRNSLMFLFFHTTQNIVRRMSLACLFSH